MPENRTHRRRTVIATLAASLTLTAIAAAQDYVVGADISSVPERVYSGTVYIDTDGQQKNILELLRGHGFNYIRQRTFVDPLADYGYGSDDSCPGKSEAWNDKDHVVAFARQIKAAEMKLLLNFHYSDTWADPGKQVIPVAWRDAESLEALADRVSVYTTEVMQALAEADALPDMVQIGNEITPGMLIHVPTEETDCYGNRSAFNVGVNGSTRNWDNLATLLGAGIDAVRAVHPDAKIMLHIENTDRPEEVIEWVRNAQSRGIEFDVLGLSAYERWQGPSSEWPATFARLAETFADLEFCIVEYGGSPELVNEIMRSLPEGRGIGTFTWEPIPGILFERDGNTLTARPDGFAAFEQLATE